MKWARLLWVLLDLPGIAALFLPFADGVRPWDMLFNQDAVSGRARLDGLAFLILGAVLFPVVSPILRARLAMPGHPARRWALPASALALGMPAAVVVLLWVPLLREQFIALLYVGPIVIGATWSAWMTLRHASQYLNSLVMLRCFYIATVLPFLVLFRRDLESGASVFIVAMLIYVAEMVLLGWQNWNEPRRRRAEAGLCVECGYDLRATPERCPECGTFVHAADAKAPISTP